MFNAIWTLSVALNGAAVATVLVYSSAAFTALLGWALMGEDLRGWKIVAVLAALAGCSLVAGVTAHAAGRLTAAGIVTGVTSGLAYAAYSLMGRSSSRRGIDPWTTLLYTFGIAAVVLLAANLVPSAGSLPGGAARPADLLWLGHSTRGWAALLLLAGGPTVVGFGLYNVSLTRLPAGTANLLLTLEPVFTAAAAFALLGERLTPSQLAGSALILAGLVALRLSEGTAGPGAKLRGPVDLATVADTHHKHRQRLAVERVDDAVAPHAQPPQPLPRRRQ